MHPKPSLSRLTTFPGSICHSCRFRLLRTSQSAKATRCHYSQQRKPVLELRRRLSSKSAKQRTEPVIDDETGLVVPTIRYYEQVGQAAPRRLRDEADFNQSMESEREGVIAQLEDLETKLADMSKLMDEIDGSGGKMDTETAGKTGRALRSLRRRPGRSAVAEPDDDVQAEPGTPRVEPRHFANASTAQREALKSLNRYLAAAVRRIEGESVDANVVMRIWKHYSATRRILSTNWEAVPQEVWELLWEILTPETDGVVNRMPHIHALTTDMQAAGVSLDNGQKLLAVEAMFISGHEKQAIESWRRMVATVGADPETTGDYWVLGLRMTCLAGDVERAERIASNLFEAEPNTDPRVLLPLIRAYMASAGGADKAWTTYQRLRDMLGSDMRIEDYDQVIASFLEASKTENALHAFADMMFSGTVDMSDKTRLPTQVANQFFLGKWLKRLIGAGDLDGAFKVLQFMETHRVLAAAIQVNGLIGAWMRSGLAENQQKAEDLAWAMIRSRMVYVNLRKRQQLVQWPVVLTLDSDETAYKTSERNASVSGQATLKVVPRATLETFALLAENYQRRGLHTKLQELWTAANEAEITNATFLVNQLLRSYFDQGKDVEARKFYDIVVKQQGVSPDGDTFLERFRALRIMSAESQDEAVAMCRQVFRDMVAASWKLNRPQITDWLPKMVLHSFRNVGDPIGLIVALRAMRKLFNFQPSEGLLAEMSLAITPRRGSGPSAATRRLMMANIQIERLLKERIKERRIAAGPAGESKGELSPEESVDELSLVLERLLWLGQKLPADQDFDVLFAKAAEDMGVTDVVVEENEWAVVKKRKYRPAR
jgi:hypothetical protein